MTFALEEETAKAFTTPVPKVPIAVKEVPALEDLYIVDFPTYKSLSVAPIA